MNQYKLKHPNSNQLDLWNDRQITLEEELEIYIRSGRFRGSVASSTIARYTSITAPEVDAVVDSFAGLLATLLGTDPKKTRSFCYRLADANKDGLELPEFSRLLVMARRYLS